MTIYNDFKTNLIRRPNTRSITIGDNSIIEKINSLYQNLLNKLCLSGSLYDTDINIDKLYYYISTYHTISFRQNFFNNIDIDDMISNYPKKLAIICNNIKVSNIEFDNIKIKYIQNNNPIETDIKFKEYKENFNSCGDYITGGCSDDNIKIKTNQQFITHNNICWYHHQINSDNLFPFMPIIIEYKLDTNELFIIDGNNRVGYAITRGIEYIPAIIIIKLFD